MYIHIICIYYTTYIYIYIGRERERERESQAPWRKREAVRSAVWTRLSKRSSSTSPLGCPAPAPRLGEGMIVCNGIIFTSVIVIIITIIIICVIIIIIICYFSSSSSSSSSSIAMIISVISMLWKGTTGVSTNGVASNLMCCFVLTYFYRPKSARAHHFPRSVKTRHFCGGPTSADPIRPQPTSRQASCGALQVAPWVITTCYIYIYIYIYIIIVHSVLCIYIYIYMYVYIYIYIFIFIYPLIYLYITLLHICNRSSPPVAPSSRSFWARSSATVIRNTYT